MAEVLVRTREVVAGEGMEAGGEGEEGKEGEAFCLRRLEAAAVVQA